METDWPSTRINGPGDTVTTRDRHPSMGAERIFNKTQECNYRLSSRLSKYIDKQLSVAFVLQSTLRAESNEWTQAGSVHLKIQLHQEKILILPSETNQCPLQWFTKPQICFPTIGPVVPNYLVFILKCVLIRSLWLTDWLTLTQRACCNLCRDERYWWWCENLNIHTMCMTHKILFGKNIHHWLYQHSTRFHKIPQSQKPRVHKSASRL